MFSYPWYEGFFTKHVASFRVLVVPRAVLDLWLNQRGVSNVLLNKPVGGNENLGEGGGVERLQEG